MKRTVIFSLLNTTRGAESFKDAKTQTISAIRITEREAFEFASDGEIHFPAFLRMLEEDQPRNTPLAGSATKATTSRAMCDGKLAKNRPITSERVESSPTAQQRLLSLNGRDEQG